MKKAIPHTRVLVHLRAARRPGEWHLYLEAYPVFENGSPIPVRKREYLNRTITTPIFDKTRTARTRYATPDPTKATTDPAKRKKEKVTYKPKRDANGIIQCKSEADQDTCIYADNVRKLRQREYDNAALYTPQEAELAAQNDRLQQDFVAYFDRITTEKHPNASASLLDCWGRVSQMIHRFANEKPIPFSQVDAKLAEDFRRFLLTVKAKTKKGETDRPLATNTAALYFCVFRTALKFAFVDEFLTVDLSARLSAIRHEESRREHLTLEELNALAKTDGVISPLIKRAALFSALTGLRHCDIQKLRWGELQPTPQGYRLNFTQKKTKGVEYMPISEQAYKLCFDPENPKAKHTPQDLVFENFPNTTALSHPIKKWLQAAGITRTITFHCFRHTYAVLQLAGGTDIYTVSKMLGHTSVKTTQIYAKVIDEKKEKAAQAITLDINLDPKKEEEKK